MFSFDGAHMEKGLAAIVIVAMAGLCFGAGETVLDGIIPKTAEGKLVQEMFGRKIADAKASATDEDDVAVSRQLLKAAEDGSTADKLRISLYTTTLRLLTQTGSEASTQLARQALEGLDALAPLEPLEKARYSKEISAHQVARSRTARVSADDAARMAREAIEATIEYAKLGASDINSAADVAASLGAAKGWATTYRLSEYSSELAELDKTAKTSALNAVKLKEGIEKVGALKRAKDVDGAKAMSKTVAQLYLEGWGDLKNAAKYYEEIDEPRAQAVCRAAKALEAEKVDPAQGLEALEGLVKVREGLRDLARQRVTESGGRLAQGLGELTLSEEKQAKLKLLTVQLEGGSDSPGDDGLRKKLLAAYGNIRGKLDVLGPERVRLTYNFSHKLQMKDWEIRSGEWEIGKGALACRTSGSSGLIECRFPFRADKPFKISFNCGGKYSVGANLYLKGWDGDDSKDAFFHLTDDGLYYNGDSYASNRAVRLSVKKAYHMEVSSKGDGQLTWKLDGQSYTYKPRYGAKGSFVLQLSTRYADRTLSAFKNVVIEGTMLPKQDWAPEESKKKDKEKDRDRRDAD